MASTGIQILVQNNFTWRGGQKLSASSKSAPVKGDANRSFRINFRGLAEVIANNRRVSRKALFVSANDPVLPLRGWDILKATKDGDRDAHRFVQELTVDMVALRETFSFNAMRDGSKSPALDSFVCARECSRVYCIVSGGIGLKSVITATLDSGFRVELYSWRGGCSHEYIRMAEGVYSKSFKIVYLDDFINKIGMETSKFFGGELPPNRTYVLDPHPNVGAKEFQAACQDLRSQFLTYLQIQLLPSEKKRHMYMVFQELKEDEYEYEADFFKQVKEGFSAYGKVVSYVTFRSPSKAYMRENYISSHGTHNMFGALNKGDQGAGGDKGERKRCWKREFCNMGSKCHRLHTQQEKDLFQANGGDSPYRVNKRRCYLCPQVEAGRICRSYTCEFSHKEHHSFCCQCATTHSRDWETDGACETYREGVISKAHAEKLWREGCIYADFEGSLVYARGYFDDQSTTHRLSNICVHREFCGFEGCSFYHTEQEKALFQEHGGITPYRLTKAGLNKLCQWCAELHEIGPDNCSLRGMVRKHPITPERAAELEKQGLIKYGPSSSPPLCAFPDAPWLLRSSEEHENCVVELPRSLKKGNYLLIDNSNAWIGGRTQAQKQYGPRGDWRINHGKLREKIVGEHEECRSVVFGSDPNATAWKRFQQLGMEVVVSKRSRSYNREYLVDNQLTQYLCEDAAALDEYSSLFKGMGSQAREAMEEMRSSRVYYIVSGDKGYLEAIRWVLERGFRVKVYAWQSGCARQYAEEMRQEAAKGGKWEGRFELVYLDGWFNDIKQTAFEHKDVPQKENAVMTPKDTESKKDWRCAGELERQKRMEAFRDKSAMEKKRGTRHCPYREGCTLYGKDGKCNYFHTDAEKQFFSRHGRKSPYITLKPFCWICLKPHKRDQTCSRNQPDRPIINQQQEERLIKSGCIRKKATIFFN